MLHSTLRATFLLLSFLLCANAQAQITYKGIINDAPVKVELVDARNPGDCKLTIQGGGTLICKGYRIEMADGDFYTFKPENERQPLTIALRDVSKELGQPKMTTFLGSLGEAGNHKNRVQIALFRQN